jgi:hypothetical protein
MSRTFKDMSGGVRARRRRAVLGRERARQSACVRRASSVTGFTRRGRRKSEESPSGSTEKESAR